nr:MAG TPA: hypothetical protein [Caudoviricetes sp.]
MAVVNLGNIKRPPICKVFKGIKHTWTDEETVGSAVKLDIPFAFSSNKTYLVFIRSISGTVTVDGGKKDVSAITVLTNRIDGTNLSGGSVFSPVAGKTSFGISIPDYAGSGEPAVYIIRPQVTDAVSLFDVGVCEL